MNKTSHPYQEFEEYRFWRKSIAELPMSDVDPVVLGAFQISPEDKVATAGSCFAQHIARYIDESGFNYFIAEKGAGFFNKRINKQSGFGVFSARYGNIYTTRQLLQLWKRAFDGFQPIEDIWQNPKGQYIDPMRPNINPFGFSTKEELLKDREYHLSRVRHMFEKLNIFVFTMGLTEAWVDKRDGTVFPVCPGVAGGSFNDEKFEFKNFSSKQVIADFEEFTSLLLSINPKAKVIVTVSPVPLMATAENRHVLVSTTLSKSVLRVAAEEVSQAFENVHYFPSYEIITGNFNKGTYYADDLRNVQEVGVNHVMKLFMKHYTKNHNSAEKEAKPITPKTKTAEQLSSEISKVLCDEELLDSKT